MHLYTYKEEIRRPSSLVHEKRAAPPHARVSYFLKKEIHSLVDNVGLDCPTIGLQALSQHYYLLETCVIPVDMSLFTRHPSCRWQRFGQIFRLHRRHLSKGIAPRLVHVTYLAMVGPCPLSLPHFGFGRVRAAVTCVRGPWLPRSVLLCIKLS